MGTASITDKTELVTLDDGKDLLFVQDDSASELKKMKIETLLAPGMIMPFAGTTAPTGWLSCDGSAVSRTTYATLFSNIGTTWGVGDGSTTFNVPDLRGLFLRGAGAHGTLNKADGSDFDGGSVGDDSNDQFQAFQTGMDRSGTSYYGRSHGAVGNAPAASAQANSTSLRYDSTAQGTAEGIYPNADGTNGTPRTGDETKPANATVLYMIKT